MNCDMCPPNSPSTAYSYVRWGADPTRQQGNLCKTCLDELWSHKAQAVQVGVGWWEQTEPKELSHERS